MSELYLFYYLKLLSCSYIDDLVFTVMFNTEINAILP